jgi:hypothetical protein
LQDQDAAGLAGSNDLSLWTDTSSLRAGTGDLWNGDGVNAVVSRLTAFPDAADKAKRDDMVRWLAPLRIEATDTPIGPDFAGTRFRPRRMTANQNRPPLRFFFEKCRASVDHRKGHVKP